MNNFNKLFRTSYSRQALIILVFIASFLFISILLNNFSKDISQHQLDSAMNRLEGNALQGTGYVSNILKEHMTYIDSLAATMSTREDLDIRESIDFLKLINKSTAFKRVAIDFPDGRSYTVDGYTLDVSKHGYLNRILEKKTFITDMTYASADNQPAISILSPIIKNDQVVAAIRGTIYVDSLGTSIDADFFSGVGYFYLIDSHGNILAKSQNINMLLPEAGNFFTVAKTLTFSHGQDIKQIRENIKAHKSGIASYSFNNQARYTYYSPVGINNWTLFVAVPTTYIDSGSEFIKGSATTLVSKISLVLFVAFLTVIYMMKCSRREIEEINSKFELMTTLLPGGILITSISSDFTADYMSPGYYDLVGYSPEEFKDKFDNKGHSTMHPDDRRKSISSMRRQISTSGLFNINVRVQHKTKGYIWVHLQGRLYQTTSTLNKLYMVAVDISEQLDTLKKLQDEKSFNSLIASLSDDGFFDYDNIKKTIRYSKNFAERIGIEEFLTDYPASVLASGRIAKDSEYMYTTSRFNTATKDLIEEEVHYKMADGQDVWYLLRYHILFNDQDKPIRAIGRMTDITKKNIHISYLQDQAQKDPLTDLYNKTATEHLIKDILATSNSSERHALMIIDIDNFKNINDNFGHLYGDIFLKDFALTLKSMFRADDVVGRIGGDEFFVFLRNFHNTQMLTNKAQRLCRIFKNTHKNEKFHCETSVSIGIATYPEYGTDFNTLYQNADKALYTIKRNGKNDFSLYSEQLFLEDHNLPALKDLQPPCSVNSSILSSLYDSDNKVDAIGSYLQKAIDTFGFCRGYIYELNLEQGIYLRTVECHSQGVVKLNNLATQMDNLNLHEQISYVKSKGIYIYRRSTVVAPFLKQLLDETGSNLIIAFAIVEDDQVQYVIGFEDKLESRKFTAKELQDISHSCGTIFTLLSVYQE